MARRKSATGVGGLLRLGGRQVGTAARPPRSSGGPGSEHLLQLAQVSATGESWPVNTWSRVAGRLAPRAAHLGGPGTVVRRAAFPSCRPGARSAPRPYPACTMYRAPGSSADRRGPPAAPRMSCPQNRRWMSSSSRAHSCRPEQAAQEDAWPTGVSGSVMATPPPSSMLSRRGSFRARGSWPGRSTAPTVAGAGSPPGAIPAWPGSRSRSRCAAASAVGRVGSGRASRRPVTEHLPQLVDLGDAHGGTEGAPTEIDWVLGVPVVGVDRGPPGRLIEFFRYP